MLLYLNSVIFLLNVSLIFLCVLCFICLVWFACSDTGCWTSQSDLSISTDSNSRTKPSPQPIGEKPNTDSLNACPHDEANHQVGYHEPHNILLTIICWNSVTWCDCVLVTIPEMSCVVVTYPCGGQGDKDKLIYGQFQFALSCKQFELQSFANC